MSFCLFSAFSVSVFLPSMLWRWWLGGRKGIRPVKTTGGVLEWLSVWSAVQTCWCHCHSLSLASEKSILVPAQPDSSGLRAIKRVCVYVCRFVWFCVFYPVYIFVHAAFVRIKLMMLMTKMIILKGRSHVRCALLRCAALVKRAAYVWTAP